MKDLKKDMKSILLFACPVAAESVRRKSGHSELCKYLPKTDQDIADSVTTEERGRSSPSKIMGSATGTRNCTINTAAAIIPETWPTVKSWSDTILTVYAALGS